MKSWFSYARPLAFAAAVAIAFGACDEQINGGGACPVLCPQEQVALQDTTFFAVELDTTISGFPGLGEELQFFLAAMGDTLQTAMVVRWDSLPTTFRRVNSPVDSTILEVDSAYIRLSVIRGDTLAPATTIDVYDVNMEGGEEADPTMVKDSMIPARLWATRTVPADSLRDSLIIRIESARLLAKIQEPDTIKRRLRLAFRVRENSGTNQVSIISNDAGGIPRIIFRPTTDTSAPKHIVLATSRTPQNNPSISRSLVDYLVVAKSPPGESADVFRVGGLPGKRAYLRFNIPSRILDSSAVMRATLLLTQRANPFSPESSDTVTAGDFGVVASGAITDLTRALQFVTSIRSDTVRMTPADAGVREFEVIDWVRAWRGTTPDKAPRAIAITLQSEGFTGSAIDFFSMESVVGTRPRLRLTYLPRPEATIP